MCKGMIGQKLGMTGVYTPEGEYIPVTVIKLGPCSVTQVKTKTTDGYDALQLGFGVQKEKLVNKPLQGHMKKSGDTYFKVLKEFRVENPGEYNIGQEVAADIFKVGEKVIVTGKLKGRGFSGVMKRHGFHGGKQSHGSHSKRIPGSIGCSAWPSKVFKGKKLPGQYGNTTKTVKNLEIIDIREEENIMILKGAVPGHRNGIVTVKKAP